MKKIIILGCGFVGKYLIEELKNIYQVYSTSRNPQVNLKDIENTLFFDLNDCSTYQNIPSDSIIVWNFPAEPIQKVEEFYHYCSTNNIEIKIVYGSTSAYKKKQGMINEEDSTDENIPRVRGENFLLSCGVNILHLSGIYGDSRSPFNWLNKGLIKNANKTVNLIHVKDIVQITKKILEIEIKNQRINISDGNAYLWKDLWKLGKERNIVNVTCPPYLDSDHRSISNQKILTILGNYQFVKI